MHEHNYYTSFPSIQHLHHFSTDLAESLLKSPLAILPILDATLIKALHNIYKAAIDTEYLVNRIVLNIIPQLNYLEVLNNNNYTITNFAKSKFALIKLS